MGDTPKSTLPPELQAANAANRAQHWKQFEADAAATAAIPAVASPPADDSSAKGWLKAAYRDAGEMASTGWHVIKDFVANPAAKVEEARTTVNKAIDDAAIKPYGGSTSVDRYKVQNPGNNL